MEERRNNGVELQKQAQFNKQKQNSPALFLSSSKQLTEAVEKKLGKKMTMGVKEQLTFQNDYEAQPRTREFGIFIICNIVLICLLFIATGMLYQTNINFASTLEQEIQSLKDSDREMRTYFENKIQQLASAKGDTSSNLHYEPHKRVARTLNFRNGSPYFPFRITWNHQDDLVRQESLRYYENLLEIIEKNRGALCREVQDLRSKIEKSKSEENSRVEALQRKLELHIENNPILGRQISPVNQTNCNCEDDFSDQLKTFRSEVNQITQNILDDFKKSLADVNQNVETLKENISKSAVETPKRNVTVLEEDVLALKQANKEIESEFDNLRNKSENVTQTLQKHREEIESVGQDILNLQTEVESLKRVNGNLTLDLETFRSDVNLTRINIQDNLRSLENDVKTLETKIQVINELNFNSTHDIGMFRDEFSDRFSTFEFRTEKLSSYTKDVILALHEHKQQVDKFGAELENTKRELTEVVESDCGGIISIPTTKESYLLQYKLNRSYSSNERCLWIVENTENSIRSKLTLKVELISQGFQGNTGLYAFKWNRDGGLASEEIKSGKEHELSAEGLYLSFASDNEASAGGKGFLLRITVTNSELRTYGSNLFYRTSAGSHTISNYQDGDQISIAINPKRPYIFEVKRVNSEENNDVLNVFVIQAQGNFSQRASLSGKLRDPLSLLTSNSNPVLLIFSSDFSTRGEGFGISWRENQNLIK